ncbi:hypothetical protein NFI96_034503 [Prochilodus magdalenae]|nr:hypothetical protein NFI96_034503 [Prochilodus magdalenae]
MIHTLKGLRLLSTAAMRHTVSEFRMPVPWGEMRGRIWGPDHGRPVLCVHGWSDNSGSFNTLIPLLPSDWRCLAIDLAGHGLSSHRPPGVFYTFPNYIADMRRLVEGGNIAGMFSALYPEMVEAIVLLDSYGFLPAHMKKINNNMRKGMEEMIEYEKKMDDRKERIYTYESAKERLKAANPALTDQSAQILLERGVQQVDGGCIFVWLTLLGVWLVSTSTDPLFGQCLSSWASQGLLKIFPQPNDLYEALQKGWEQKSSIVTVEGDHHVHLNDPAVVAPIITDFLQSGEPEHPDSQAAKL